MAQYNSKAVAVRQKPGEMLAELKRTITAISKSNSSEIAQIGVRRAMLQTLVDNAFVRGVHFDKLPGTNKDTLLQPGAELVQNLMRVLPIAVWNNQIDYESGVFHYECTVYLVQADTAHIHPDGSVEGIPVPGGSDTAVCTSMESAFRFRQAKRVCPECGQETINHSKPPKTGWYCWAKLGGCGKQYEEDDTRITEQTVGQIVNANLADQINAIKKRAYKRAFVGAIKRASGLSDIFTTDMEDMAANERAQGVDIADDEPPVDEGHEEAKHPPADETHPKAVDPAGDDMKSIPVARYFVQFWTEITKDTPTPFSAQDLLELLDVKRLSEVSKGRRYADGVIIESMTLIDPEKYAAVLAKPEVQALVKGSQEEWPM